MAARRIEKCYYDEERGSFHKECIIEIVNALVGRPVLNDANFETAMIKSSKEENAEFRYRFFLYPNGTADATRFEIPVFYGTRYGNSSGSHINSRRNRLPAGMNPAQIELVKAIMRLGALGSSGYLSSLRGSPRNYEVGEHTSRIFPGQQEILARRFENLQREEAGGGAAYHQALNVAGATTRNAYMHNLNAARANVRAAAMANYTRQLEAAQQAVREQAMLNYIAGLGPMTAAKDEHAVQGGAEINENVTIAQKKKGGYRKSRKTRKYSRRR